MKTFLSLSPFLLFILFCPPLLFHPSPSLAQHTHPLVPYGEGKNVVNQSTVFGSIPKSIFASGVLYNLGPVSSREVAILHDGRDFLPPPSFRQWRQTIFELDKNKLYTTTLPDYLHHIQAAEEYRWQYSYDNRQPLLLADVSFEWFDRDLTEYPQLVQVAKGTFKLRSAPNPSLPTRKNRFFSASLVDDTINSRLVTFALKNEFLFTNSDDPITEVEMIMGEESIKLLMGGIITIDLGKKTGMKKALLTATHVSKRTSKTVLSFNLEKLPSGQWSNMVILDGVPDFATTRLQTIRFRRPADLKELLDGE